jgi:hypothetical protein
MKLTILTIACAVLLLMVCSPRAVVMEAQAAVEDPIDAHMAPIFDSIVYTLQEPAYSTSCDSRGDFKVSVGSPTITVDDSKVEFTTDTALETRMVLSSVDAPEINETRAYFQIAFSLNKVATGYTNISLFDNDADSWINVSITASKFYYDYLDSTQKTGILYATAVIDTQYVLGVDLTATSVTYYLYNSAGTLLANKYVAGQDLVGGNLKEIRFEHAVTAGKTLSIDYLYVLATPEIDAIDAAGVEMDSIKTDTTLDNKRVDLDPTELDIDHSLRAEIFGFEEPDIESEVTEEKVLNEIGLEPEKEQRRNARFVAEGWSSGSGAIEDALKDYIADLESVEPDEVYIIDYYIDNLQLKLTFNPTVVNNLVDRYEEVYPLVVEAVQEHFYGASSSVVRIQGLDLSAVGWIVSPITALIVTGLTNPVNNALDDAKDIADRLLDEMEEGANRTWNEITDTREDFNNFVSDWADTSQENFNLLRSDFNNFVSVSQAQVSSLVSGYQDLTHDFTRAMSDFYSSTMQQWQATNGILAKLIMSHTDIVNQSQQLSGYFAGQLARTNEVVLNITSALTNSLSPSNFWGGAMSDGKLGEDPLTISSFFGNDTATYYVWAIIAVAIVVAVLIVWAILKGRRNSSAGGKVET